MSRREKREMAKKMNKKPIIIGIAVFSILLLIPLIWYSIAISPVSRSNDEIIQVTIPLGTSTSTIASMLSDYDLIRNETAFRIYVRLSGGMDFQAGTYPFKQSMRVSDITEMLQTGRVYDDNQIRIRFIEGRNIRWIARTIAEYTNNTVEDVFELLADEEYIESLVERFWFLTDEIQHEDVFYPLEGYLFPDTYYFRDEDVTVEEIFERMLVRMDQILTEFKDEIEESGFTVHEIITIASIIEAETSRDGFKNVASVIFNRLDINMALEMCSTTKYSVGSDLGDREPTMAEINAFHPYNTRGPNMEGRLPIGPIASVGRTSIEATLRPNDTNYLFFVSDSNSVLHFRETLSQHNAIIRELRDSEMWYTYGR